MYTYDEVSTGVVVILGVLAAFTLIVSAWKSWQDVTKPAMDLHNTVVEHSTKLKSTDERLTYLEDANRLQLKMLLMLSTHLIEGNNVGALKDVRDEMQAFLINQGGER